MNICINAFCDSKASLAPFDPMGSVQEAVASEKYGKPPGIDIEDDGDAEKENNDTAAPVEEHLQAGMSRWLKIPAFLSLKIAFIGVLA